MTGKRPKSSRRSPNRRPTPPDTYWQWFWELDGCRLVGITGLSSITYVDLDAWSRMTVATPDAAEVAALKVMNRARLSAR